jgi:hypothetical protein
MTKAELMETYTAEQLAEMVVKLNNAMDMINYSESFLKSGLFDNPAVAAYEARINIMQNKINNLEEDNGRLQAKLDTYNNYLLPRCTKEAKEMIDHNHFSGVRIVTWEQWNNRENKSMNISDIQKCQEEYKKLLKESPLEGMMNKITKDIIEQKNNAMAMEFTRIICDLLKRYGVYVHCMETKFGEKITTNSIEEQYGIVFDSMDFSQHDKEFTDEIEKLKQNISDLECDIKTAGEKIQDLAGENMKLQCERNDYKTKAEFLEVDRIRVKQNEISDFLPTEPIKVADMLINAEREYERNPIAKAFCGTDKGTCRIFDISELRQIAEHLLVYCNNQKENVNE